MIIESVEERLSQLALFGEVGRAADFASLIEREPEGLPAVYVMRLAEKADPSLLLGRVSQKVSLLIGVVFLLRGVGDTRGGAVSADLDSIRDRVMASLLGWSVSVFSPLQFDGGAVQGYQGGYIWWQDRFQTDFYIEQGE